MLPLTSQTKGASYKPIRRGETDANSSIPSHSAFRHSAFVASLTPSGPVTMLNCSWLAAIVHYFLHTMDIARPRGVGAMARREASTPPAPTLD
jgi:hypothetical protein